MTKFNTDINIEEKEWIKSFPNAKKLIKKAIIETLKISAFANYAQTIEVSVLLTNDNNIKKLNYQYRKHNKATNVLSFPLNNFIAGNYKGIQNYITLGDVIFSLETIKKEAQEQNKNIENHFTHLAVHGVLHLIGYDHEYIADAKIMEALEVKILTKLGIDDPY